MRRAVAALCVAVGLLFWAALALFA